MIEPQKRGQIFWGFYPSKSNVFSSWGCNVRIEEKMSRIEEKRGNRNAFKRNHQWPSGDYAMSELRSKCRNWGADQFWHLLLNSDIWSNPPKMAFDAQKRGKKAPQKKAFPESILVWTFCKKNGSKLVKFGPCGPIYILPEHIGGRHPVPCLSRETGYSNVVMPHCIESIRGGSLLRCSFDICQIKEPNHHLVWDQVGDG